MTNKERNKMNIQTVENQDKEVTKNKNKQNSRKLGQKSDKE